MMPGDQFVNPRQCQRYDARWKRTEDHCQQRQCRERAGDRQQGHGNRLHHQHQADTRFRPQLIREKTIAHRPDNRAQAVHHPDQRADMWPGPEAASHVIDQEYHGRHQPRRHKCVLGKQQVNARVGAGRRGIGRRCRRGLWCR
ncbi:hypothetical protein D3C84_788110 [compost metagenome]